MDVVRVAVDGGHHRAGDAAGDAAVVEAPVLPGISRAASFSRRLASRLALTRFCRLCRDLAIGRIGHEPGAAVRSIVVLEPVHRAGRARELAERRTALD